jgi:cytochrome b
VLLLSQALTGTVNADDVLFEGPFRYVFDGQISDKLAELHELLFNILLGFIGLHVLTVIYYERVRRSRLLWPMIVGRDEGRVGTGPAQPVYKAIAVAALLALALWGLIEAAPKPPPAFYW